MVPEGHINFGYRILSRASCTIKRYWLESVMLVMKMVELEVKTPLVNAHGSRAESRIHGAEEVKIQR